MDTSFVGCHFAKKWGIIILLSCWIFILPAQNISVKHYSTKEGLPDGLVFRLMSDPLTGFLWIGTDRGLSRFDGNRFDSFIFNEPESMNSILAIENYAPDTLLLSYYREGLFLYSKGRLTRFHQNLADMSRFTTQIVQENSNRQWILSSAQFFYRENDSVYSPDWVLQAPKGIQHNFILKHPKLGMLFGMSLGLLRLENDTVAPLLAEKWRTKNITAGTLGSNGDLLLGIDNGVYRVRDNQCSFLFKLPNSKRIKILYEDSRGWLWCATEEKELVVFRNGQLTDVYQLIGTNSIIINDIEEDIENNIWLATYGNGVYQIKIGSGYKTHQLDSLGPTEFIKSLYKKKDGSILAGGVGHLYQYKQGVWSNFRLDALEPAEFVHSIAESDKGELFIGTNRSTYVIHEQDTCKLIKEASFLLESAPDGTMWSGRFKGLKGLKKIVNCQLESTEILNNYNCRISALVHDKNNDLWIASDSGIFFSHDQQLIRYSKENGLPSNKVNDLLLDKNGHVWAATTKGVCQYDGQKWTHFSLDDHFSKPICRTLIVDDHGGMWVATSVGLFYFDANKEFTLFPGLKEDLISMTVDDRGHLWLGTNHSIVEFFGPMPLPPNSPPKPQITAIQTQDSLHVMSAEVELPYSNNRLIVHYTAVAFNNSEDLRFHYKWADESTWQTTKLRSLEFHALPPGEHQLLIGSSQYPNTNISEPVQFLFSVETPFWQAWWFVILIGALGLGIIYLVVHLRVTNIRKKEQEKQATQHQLTTLKHQALNAMMNPHFITNALISIENFIGIKTKEEIRQYIGDFSNLIRLNLIYANQTYIGLEEELVRLETYLSLEQLRFQHQFDYAIEVSPQLDKALIEVPNMVIQPFVENAIKHGLLPLKGAGKVTISFAALPDDCLAVTITDSGVGITASALNKPKKYSFGIQLTLERLRLAGQSIPVKIQNGQNVSPPFQGTQVVLTLLLN